MRPSTLAPSLALLIACGASPRPEPSAPVAAAPECPAPPEPAKTEPPEPPAESEPDKLVLEPVSYADMPGWTEDEVGDALPALRLSCRRIMKRGGKRLVGRDGTAGRVKDWRAVCRKAEAVDESNHKAARVFFEQNFSPFLAHNNEDSQGRFTGYYEAAMRGSRRKHGPYQYPLYKRPDDLVMVNMRNFVHDPKRRRIAGRVVGGLLKPYETRKEIREGALAGKGLELVWIDNPVDGFFTQIQGSGIVALDDGSHMRIGYAGQNGHTYTAIGRELVRDGHITREEMSMQAIRSWLQDNPNEADEMMDRNEAFVFFTELSASGPLGSQGVPLTAERSVAIDRKFIPQSVPLFIDTEVPSSDGEHTRSFRQLTIAQDSGGAIRGPVRADIFWGASKEGAEIAGRLKSKGRYFLLLPNEVAKARTELADASAKKPATL